MFGNIVIVLALLAGIFSTYKYYKALNGNLKSLNQARIGYHTMTILVITASVFLFYLILTHQYEYKYVFEYSNAELSTGLLISSFFAGQEGSFLLWLLFIVIIGVALQSQTSKVEGLESRVMMIYSLIAVFLIAMVTPMLKSPFHLIWSQTNYVDIKYFNQSILGMPIFQNFLVSDQSSKQNFVRLGPDLYSVLQYNGITFGDFLIKGKGLNPLLQNFWMQIHPPILFLGFALMTVPFTYAVSALIKNKYDQWIRHSLPWTLTASIVLGLGLMIGGYWAYGVLGWGGYWGWDPVENASLIPWIISIALIHTMLVQKQTQVFYKPGRFAKTNLILAAVMFILVIYSTFLTRSGILSQASVHSFEDPGMTVYLFLLFFIITFIVIGIGGVYYRRKSLTNSTEFKENLLSREIGLFYGAMLLIASTIVVFVGTSAPILGQSVETTFYNQMNLPLVILIGLLIGISLFLRWGDTNKSEFIKSIGIPIVASLVLSMVLFHLFGLRDIKLAIFLLSIIFTITVNIQMLVKVMKNGFYFWGGHIAHIGFAIFLLGVLTTSTAIESKQIELPKGTTKNIFNYELTFLGIKSKDNDNKYSFNIKVKEGYNTFIASPVMFISDYNNSIMREPDIIEGFSRDLYISPTSYVDENENKKVSNNSSSDMTTTLVKNENVPGEILTVDVSIKPFISLVWFGVGIMSVGFTIVIIRRNKENSII